MLHLLDAASPQAVPATCACLRALARADAQQRVVLFGGEPLRAAAAKVGLKADAVLAPPLGKPWLNLNAARRTAAQVCGGAPPAVTAWSIDSLLFARLAFARTPAALVLLQAPTEAQVRLLGLLQRIRPFELQAPRALLAGGTLAQVMAKRAVTPIDPPVALPSSPAASDGFASIALVGLHADAWRGAQVLGIAEAARGILPGMTPRARLRVHPRQPGLAHATRLVCNLRQPERLAETPAMDAPWLLPEDCAAALVLSSPRGPDATQTLALPWLAHQNWPLIAEDTPALRCLLDGATSIQWVKAGDIPALAHACGQVMKNRQNPAAA